MSKKLNMIWDYISHYKYLITFIVGFTVVFVTDENSLRQHILYRLQIMRLQEEVQKFKERHDDEMRLLRGMRKGGDSYAKIARERYYMKTDDEDIFVLSSDLPDLNEQEDNLLDDNDDNETFE